MRKQFFTILLCGLPLMLAAQESTDAYQMSRSELRGTARYMSMAGAFGALGGDLSAINQNPGGIGVYRSSDVGFTLDFDIQSAKAENAGVSNTTNQFKFNCNNAGYVGTYKMDSETLPNINWGFSYSHPQSFNRHYAGRIGTLNSSISNYIAGATNNGGWTKSDLTTTDNYDPYTSSSSTAPWISILAYDSYIMNPDSKGTSFQGLYGDGTTGYGEFETTEEGGVDEYNFTFGGNLLNKFYWGLGIGCTDLHYTATTYYGEALTNAYVAADKDNPDNITSGTANYGFVNYLHTVGTGANFKLGFIFKPINEFRIGFAFHTPTYYDMHDTYYTVSSYQYFNNTTDNNTGGNSTNNGYNGDTWYQIRTPWKFIASMAGVVGTQGIISAEYEYVGYNTMEVLSDDGDVYTDTKERIKDYYQPAHIFRIGGEFRATPEFSLRLGYSYQTSPVKDNVRNGYENIVTTSTNTQYIFDKSMQYITAGLGYHYKGFYTDMAYVFGHRESDYHAFSPVVNGGNVLELSPTAKITNNNNQLVFSFGYRF
jgi:hypothetical protein